MTDTAPETTDDTDSATRTNKPVHLEDAEDLAAFVADHDLALVEFYTEGCPKCQALEPILGNVARATDAAVGTLNPRDDPPLIEEYNVRSVPLLLVFEDGELVERKSEGFQGAEDIVALVENRGEA